MDSCSMVRHVLGRFMHFKHFEPFERFEGTVLA